MSPISKPPIFNSLTDVYFEYFDLFHRYLDMIVIKVSMVTKAWPDHSDDLLYKAEPEVKNLEKLEKRFNKKEI